MELATPNTGAEAFMEDAPRDLLRTTIAPIAATASLLALLGVGIFVPSHSEEKTVEATTSEQVPVVEPTTSDVLDVRTRESVSRSEAVRPALTVEMPTPTPTPKATPSAKPTRSAKATPSATPTATKSTPAASATPTATVPALGAVSGTRYATTVVNVRALPSSTAEKLDVLAEGDAVQVTENWMNGFRQVSLNGKAGWVSGDYLTRTKPAAKPTSTTTSSSSSSSSTSGSTSGSSGGSCSISTSIVAHLTSATQNVYQRVCANFPNVSSFGGYRAGDSGEHGQGRALDVMISGQAGWAVANWARANAYSLGITEVIYSQQIWTTQRASEGWRSMSDRGSATANHFDHVHITVG